MSKPVNNMDIYYFYNISDAVAQSCIKGMPFTFRYFKDIIGTNIKMFDYEDLPDDLTQRIIETALTFNNFLCLYKSVALDKIILCKWLPQGEFDYYLNPTNVNLIALNGKPIQNNVPFKDIVLVKDNALDIIPFIVLSEYIGMMNNIERTIDKQVDIAKLPAVFTGDKQTVESFKKLITDGLGFKPFAVADKTLTENSLQNFDIKFPILPMDLLELYKNYRNFSMESMGIYGISSQKRERLLSTEVQSQNDYVDIIYQERVDCRQSWIEEANKKFGTNIKLVEAWKQYREEEIDLEIKEEAQLENEVKTNVVE